MDSSKTTKKRKLLNAGYKDSYYQYSDYQKSRVELDELRHQLSECKADVVILTRANRAFQEKYVEVKVQQREMVAIDKNMRKFWKNMGDNDNPIYEDTIEKALKSTVCVNYDTAGTMLDLQHTDCHQKLIMKTWEIPDEKIGKLCMFAYNKVDDVFLFVYEVHDFHGWTFGWANTRYTAEEEWVYPSCGMSSHSDKLKIEEYAEHIDKFVQIPIES